MKKPIWILAGVLLAAACTGVRAQDNTTPPAAPTPPATTDQTTTTQSTTTTTPGTTDQSTTTTTTTTTTSEAPPPPVLNYWILNNKTFDIADLNLARDHGFTGRQTAIMVHIAELSGMPFRLIYDQVLNGMTFNSLAEEYNLSLNDVYNLDRTRDEIEDYRAAYHATGWDALKNHVPDNGDDPVLDQMEAQFNQMNASFPAPTTPLPEATGAPAPAPPAAP